MIETLSIPGWIRVEERRPERMRDVLLAIPGNKGAWHLDLGFLRGAEEWILTGTILRVEPSHWMPLPEPPTVPAEMARFHHGKPLS